jgi:Raf kinase inhibitor-like YbhB/YbcL family protein
LRKQVKLLAVAATAVILAQLGCKGSSVLGTHASLSLSSPSWSDGHEIPQKFTCDRENVSPALSWSSPPSQTQSLVLIFSDPYWLVGSFSHWILYNLPSKTRQLPEAVPQQTQLPGGGQQGQNDVGHIGYYGPCPGFGSSHRYVFQLYALDSQLKLPASPTQGQVEVAMRGHILAKGSLIAPYSRPHSEKEVEPMVSESHPGSE